MSAATGPQPPRATLVTDAEEFGRVLAMTESEPVVGLDTETTGLDPHAARVRTVQIAAGGSAWVCDVAAVRDLTPLRGWLGARARGRRQTLLHNAAFDLAMLRAATGGLPLGDLSVSDLMLWSQLVACGRSVPGGHGLAALAMRWLGIDLPKTEQAGDWTGDLRPEQIEYAGRDAWVLVPLAGAMWEAGVAREGLAAVAAVEDACVPAVADMEYDGIAFDRTYGEELTRVLRKEAADARAPAVRLLAAGGRLVQTSLFGDVEPDINLASPAQVRSALQALGLPVTSTAEDALRPLAAEHPAVAALLHAKRTATLLGAFESLPKHIHPETGRIHASYTQITGAGRFACSGPNVQQVPHAPRFRRAFVAPPGRRLVIADYSQIELRIMAKLSGDRRMREAYRQGEDLHRLTASLVAGVGLEAVSKEQRQLAKAVNFGLIYGMSAAGLRAYAANAYGVRMAPEQAQDFRRRFFQAYAGVAAFHRRQDTEARRARETRTLLGRCHRWPNTAMGLPELANCPDQGTGADILKRAIAGIRPLLLRTGSALVACIHDELVVEAPADRADEVKDGVRAAMIAAGADLLDPLPVEVEAVVGATWADKA